MQNKKKHLKYQKIFPRSAICAAGILLSYSIGLLLIALAIFKRAISEDAGVHFIPPWSAFCSACGGLLSMRSEKSIVFSTVPTGIFLLSLFVIGIFLGEPDWAGEGRLIPFFSMAAAFAAGAFLIYRSERNRKRRSIKL